MLYEQCIGYVLTVARRYVSNDSEIQDVIQEVFARVFLKIESFDSSKGEFKFWIRRIVINQSLQLYRQGKSPRLHVTLDETDELEFEEDISLNKLTKQDIEKLLYQMPNGYRQVFLLIVIDEYSHKEVAELLNISADTSRSQLFKAKKWLRKKYLINHNKIAVNGF